MKLNKVIELFNERMYDLDRTYFPLGIDLPQREVIEAISEAINEYGSNEDVRFHLQLLLADARAQEA